MTFDPPNPVDDGDRKLLADVEDHGWHVVGILETDHTPTWSFTVGLQHNFNHPEMVIFGLPTNVAHQVLNVAGEEVRAGRRFHRGDTANDLLEGYSAVLRSVDKLWYKPFLGTALWFYRGSEFETLQVFWPDRQGVMPWNPDAASWLRGSQPLLFESNDLDAGISDLLTYMETHG